VTRLLIAARYGAFLLTAVALGLLVWADRRVQYEQSLTAFFPEGDPIVVAYQKAADTFGSDNFVFVGYDDPDLLTPAGMDRLAELTAALAPAKHPAVISVESLDAAPQFWRLDNELVRIEGLPAFLRNGAVRVAKSLVQNADPAGAGLSIGAAVRGAKGEELDALRATIRAHPLLKGTLIGADGKSTVAVARLKGMEEQDIKTTVRGLRAAADAFAAKHKLGQPALVGPPVLLADGFEAIETDGQRLAIAGMLLIALVTFSVTRSPWWTVLPILAGWVVWRAAETVLAVLGVRLALSGGPLVAQIIVLTMPAASHLAIHFRDDLRRTSDRQSAAEETLRSVGVPIVWCAVTGALGYAALLTSNVVPVRQFGAILAACTLVAAMLTLVLSPLAMKPPFARRVRPAPPSRTVAAIERMLEWIIRRPGAVVAVMVLVALGLAVGMTRLVYESNYINAFGSKTRVVQDYRFIESRLGGIGLVSLVVPLERMDLETLGRFRSLDGAILEEHAGAGRVTSVLSPATVLDPEGKLAALPPEKAAHALATKLELIRAAPQGKLLDSFLNDGAKRARIMVRLPEQQPAPDKMRVFGQCEAQARAAFGPSSGLTGLSYLLTQTTRGVMASSWSTFLSAAGAIVVMLFLAYRSAGMAVLALLPSVLAVGLVLGITGWLGVKLDLATALVASVALGLSVDDTFHCLLQFREHRRRNESFRDALIASYDITGPGVILSSLAVGAGFAVLWLSEFVPFSNFGLMVGLATLGSSFGNLVLLPACLALGERRRGGRRPVTAGTASAEPAVLSAAEGGVIQPQPGA
jgi:predicted RND superfamily exporter protein